MLQIRTQRLTLQQPTYDDRSQLVDLLGNFSVSQYLSNVPYPYTERDAHFWLTKTDRGKYNLGIFSNNSLIGGIGFSPKADHFFELGYWLGINFWGQGYATEACEGLLKYAKTKTQLRKFRANVARGNIASYKVLKKIGFRCVGEGSTYSLSKGEEVNTLIYTLNF